MRLMIMSVLLLGCGEKEDDTAETITEETGE
jgi:hypothetical protein